LGRGILRINPSHFLVRDERAPLVVERITRLGLQIAQSPENGSIDFIALQTMLFPSVPRNAILRFDSFPIRACVFIMIDLPVLGRVFP